MLYTVRRASQGGAFAGTQDEYLELVRLGFLLGAELVDVDCTLDQEAIDGLLQYRRSSLIVGSFYDPGRVPRRDEVQRMLQLCALRGCASFARMVVAGTSRADGWLVHEVAETTGQIPAVALCVGEGGQLSQVLSRAACPVAYPGLSGDNSGLLSVQDVLSCRTTLGLFNLGARQLPIFGPWGAELPRLFAAACGEALQALGLGQCCHAYPSEGGAEARRMLGLASVGGALVTGVLKELAYPWADLTDDLCRAVGAVDCLVKTADGHVVGYSTERHALRARIRSLGADSGAADRVGVVLGGGAAGRAARAALLELGFGRTLSAAGPEPEQLFNFLVTLDKTSGEKLGIDISHDNGETLRVERVTGDLVAAWNAAQRSNSEICVSPGDTILAVNGRRGSVANLVEELNSDRVMRIEMSRPLGMEIAGEKLDDLVALAALSSLDVLVLAEPPEQGFSSLTGAQWLLPTITRLHPVVIETVWPPPPREQPVDPSASSKPTPFEAARQAECDVVEAPELIFERACKCLDLWSPGIGPKARRFVAQGLLRELSQRPVLGREPPGLLLDEAGATPG